MMMWFDGNFSFPNILLQIKIKDHVDLTEKNEWFYKLAYHFRISSKRCPDSNQPPAILESRRKKAKSSTPLISKTWATKESFADVGKAKSFPIATDRITNIMRNVVIMLALWLSRPKSPNEFEKYMRSFIILEQESHYFHENSTFFDDFSRLLQSRLTFDSWQSLSGFQHWPGMQSGQWWDSG